MCVCVSLSLSLSFSYCSFELGVRVPLIIRTPWLQKSIGKFTPALAEAVDLFPTFVELSGLGAAVMLPADQVLQGVPSEEITTVVVFQQGVMLSCHDEIRSIIEFNLPRQARDKQNTRNNEK